MDYKFKLSKIHCAGCALALEENINEIEGVSAQINFVTKHIKLKIETENPAETLTAVKIAVSKFDHAIELLDIHDEDDEEKKERLERITNISRFSISVLLMIVGFMLQVEWVKILFCGVAYILAAYDVLWGAVLNIKRSPAVPCSPLFWLTPVLTCTWVWARVTLSTTPSVPLF